MIARYFFLFIACNLFAGCIYHFFLPETVSNVPITQHSTPTKTKILILLQ